MANEDKYKEDKSYRNEFKPGNQIVMSFTPSGSFSLAQKSYIIKPSGPSCIKLALKCSLK